MEKFLKNLRKSLEDAKIENVDDIISKYEYHFIVGHEAGMSDEEIIERFESIDDIVESLKESNETEDKDFEFLDDHEESLNESKDNEEKLHLYLDLSLFEEFNFESIEKDEIILEADEDVYKYVSVEKKPRSFKLKNKNHIFIGDVKAKYSGTLYIGKNIKFSEVIINNVSGDVELCSLTGDQFQLQNVSGDIQLNDLNFSEKAIISNVSGDMEIGNIVTPKLDISTVNGDFSVKEICCDDLKLNTVNGDLNIDYINEANVVFSSVNGDINIKKGNVIVLGESNVNGEILIDNVKISKKLSETMDDLTKNLRDNSLWSFFKNKKKN